MARQVEEQASPPRKPSVASLRKSNAPPMRQSPPERPPAEMQPPAPPPTSPEPPAPRTQVKGGYGRAASVRVVKRASVADQDKFYAQTKNRDDVRKFFGDLATKMVKDGHSPDGITITEEREVR